MKSFLHILVFMCNARTFWPHFFFLLIILFIVLLPVNWDGNEENYFQLSYQTVEPEAFPENHAIFDASKGRVVPEFLIGYTVKLLGYEGAHIFIRLLCVLGYAIAFSQLFKYFRFRIIDGAIVLGLFILAGQQLFGGAWLFRGGESKVFAYIFVILAILENFKERHYRALLWLAAATYMHFLVGLFWTVFIYSTTLVFQRNVKNLIKYAGFYTLVMSPLLLLLIPELLVKAESNLDYTADYIYSRIRNPHHVDPFQSVYVFLASWAQGVVKLVVIMAFCFYVFINHPKEKLAMLVLVTGSYLLFFLLLSFFDRETLFFGKFYLFRPTGLVLLFSLVLFVALLRKQETEPQYGAYLFAGAFILLTAILPIAKTNILLLKTPEQRYVTAGLLEAIKKHSKPNDIVLTDPANKWDVEVIQMVRDIPRPTLVAWKFVPTQKADILRWYELMLFKEELFNAGCSADSKNIQHLIVFDEKRLEAFKTCSEVLYQDNNLTYFKLL